MLSTRRSSLPLSSLEVGLGDVSGLVKRLKVSPCHETQDQSQCPKIVVEDGKILTKTSSDVNLSISTSFNEGLLAPLNLSNRYVYRRKSYSAASENDCKENNTKLYARRSSCGTIYSSSPDSTRVKSPFSFWGNKQGNHNSLSPIPFWTTKSPSVANTSSTKSPRPTDSLAVKATDKSSNESPSTRNQSCLHFPSLSPCFEDRPKSSNFSFSRSPGKTCFQNSGNLTGSFSLEQSDKNSKDESKGRRSSMHTLASHSTSFPHPGILLCPDHKLRRKSFDASTINFAEWSSSQKESKELEKGNTLLLTSSKFMTVNSVIGKGGFGCVKVGMWKGEKVAVKMIMGRKAETSSQNERKSLQLLPHINIVSTIAVAVPADESNANLEFPHYEDCENENKTRIIPAEILLTSLLGVVDHLFTSQKSSDVKWSLVISELCTPTTLLTLINSTAFISDVDKLRIVRQIASALHHLHTSGFVHHDVKPANCFLTPSGIVKLGDFGCMCNIGETPTHLFGTAAYQSPEALKGEPLSDRSDIYSLGITAWQVLYRDTPFAGFHPHVVIYKVTRLSHRPESPKSSNKATFIESAMNALIKRCWVQVPSDRPSAASIIRVTAALFYSS